MGPKSVKNHTKEKSQTSSHSSKHKASKRPVRPAEDPSPRGRTPVESREDAASGPPPNFSARQTSPTAASHEEPRPPSLAWMPQGLLEQIVQVARNPNLTPTLAYALSHSPLLSYPSATTSLLRSLLTLLAPPSSVWRRARTPPPTPPPSPCDDDEDATRPSAPTPTPTPTPNRSGATSRSSERRQVPKRSSKRSTSRSTKRVRTRSRSRSQTRSPTRSATRSPRRSPRRSRSRTSTRKPAKPPKRASSRCKSTLRHRWRKRHQKRNKMATARRVHMARRSAGRHKRLDILRGTRDLLPGRVVWPKSFASESRRHVDESASDETVSEYTSSSSENDRRGTSPSDSDDRLACKRRLRDFGVRKKLLLRKKKKFKKRAQLEMLENEDFNAKTSLIRDENALFSGTMTKKTEELKGIHRVTSGTKKAKSESTIKLFPAEDPPVRLKNKSSTKIKVKTEPREESPLREELSTERVKDKTKTKKKEKTLKKKDNKTIKAKPKEKKKDKEKKPAKSKSDKEVKRRPEKAKMCLKACKKSKTSVEPKPKEKEKAKPRSESRSRECAELLEKVRAEVAARRLAEEQARAKAEKDKAQAVARARAEAVQRAKEEVRARLQAKVDLQLKRKAVAVAKARARARGKAGLTARVEAAAAAVAAEAWAHVAANKDELVAAAASKKEALAKLDAALAAVKAESAAENQGLEEAKEAEKSTVGGAGSEQVQAGAKEGVELEVTAGPLPALQPPAGLTAAGSQCPMASCGADRLFSDVTKWRLTPDGQLVLDHAQQSAGAATAPKASPEPLAALLAPAPYNDSPKATGFDFLVNSRSLGTIPEETSPQQSTQVSPISSTSVAPLTSTLVSELPLLPTPLPSLVPTSATLHPTSTPKAAKSPTRKLLTKNWKKRSLTPNPQKRKISPSRHPPPALPTAAGAPPRIPASPVWSRSTSWLEPPARAPPVCAHAPKEEPLLAPIRSTFKTSETPSLVPTIKLLEQMFSQALAAGISK